MKKIHPLSKLGLVSFCSIVALGCGDVSSQDDDALLEENIKGAPPAIVPENAERAVALELSPGVPWEISTATEQADGIVPQAASVTEKSWPVLQAGQYHYVTLSLSSAESLAAFAHPYDFNGDIDVHLYKWDSYQGWVYNKGSALSSGYIDSVFTPPYTAGWAGSYLLMFHCYSGTCNFRTSVSIGDDSNFYTSSVYLNQRSFTAKEQKCQGSSGAWVANGECMCAPSSAAMALVAGGKRNINELGSSAVDLFTTNNSYGAADRVALMNRLKSKYGYGTCEELSATMANIRDRLRYKYLVLFRSKSFSSAGHYVQVRGYATASDGTIRLRVNDPMGAWLSKDKWNPQNSTTTGYGQDTWLKFADITTSNPSIIACK